MLLTPSSVSDSLYESVSRMKVDGPGMHASGMASGSELNTPGRGRSPGKHAAGASSILSPSRWFASPATTYSRNAAAGSSTLGNGAAKRDRESADHKMETVSVEGVDNSVNVCMGDLTSTCVRLCEFGMLFDLSRVARCEHTRPRASCRLLRR